MGVRVTEAFIAVAQPLLDNLRKETGDDIEIAWDMASWDGQGTMHLHVIPTLGRNGKKLYERHKTYYDHYFDELNKAGYLQGTPYYDSISLIEVHGRRWSYVGIIKGLETTEE